MSELHQFVKNFTNDFKSITCRKAYGLDAFFMDEKIFIVLTKDQRIALKVEDYDTQIFVSKINDVSEWILNDKKMQDWYLLPMTVNKKKNKLYPILEMAAKVVLHPKKKKATKMNKNKKTSKNVANTQVLKEKPVPSSLLRKLFGSLLPSKK